MKSVARSPNPIRTECQALVFEQPFTLRDWKVFRRAVDRSIDENY